LCRCRQQHPAGLDLDREALQRLALAGALEAIAVLDAELCAVGGAEEPLAVTGQKAIREQLQRRALMRAGVAVGEQQIAAAIDEEIEPRRAFADQESARRSFRNLVDPAEADAAGRGRWNLGRDMRFLRFTR
jgi:hypothetical protein